MFLDDDSNIVIELLSLSISGSCLLLSLRLDALFPDELHSSLARLYIKSMAKKLTMRATRRVQSSEK